MSEKVKDSLEKEQAVNKTDIYEVTKTQLDYQKILKILYFDGQIDSEWTEHLNMLSSENKMHYFPNSDTINLNDFKIFFESPNLLHCSPTLVNMFLILGFKINFIQLLIRKFKMGRHHL